MGLTNVGEGIAYMEVYLVSADFDLGKWKQKNTCEFTKWHKGGKQQHKDTWERGLFKMALGYRREQDEIK